MTDKELIKKLKQIKGLLKEHIYICVCMEITCGEFDYNQTEFNARELYSNKFVDWILRVGADNLNMNKTPNKWGDPWYNADYDYRINEIDKFIKKLTED